MAGLIAGAGINAVTGLVGAGKQAGAIKSAAKIQADSAKYAADLSAKGMSDSLNFTKGVYSDAKDYVAPYQAAGTKAIGQLGEGTAPGGVFNSSPTSAQVLGQDPGYAFRMQQGQLALERAEAAGGGVGSGGALKAGVQYGQDQASAEYGAAYNRFMQNRQSNFGNLSEIAGLGENANSALTAAGTGASANVAHTTLAGTAAQADYLTQGANAQAGGLIGQANAWSSALGNIGNVAQQGLAQYNANRSAYGKPPDFSQTDAASLGLIG